MTRDEFLSELPLDTECFHCKRKLVCKEWHLQRFGKDDFMAMCGVKCEPCSWLKICAAGSSEEAFEAAVKLRYQLAKSLGMRIH